MLESISSRIAREKAEREKFARQRQESAGSRRWATTFGVYPLNGGDLLGLELIVFDYQLCSLLLLARIT